VAQALRTQLFDSFLGQQEGIHPVILPDVFSSSGSKNLWMDKYARARKLNGYSKQNASAVTTDTGGSTTRLRSLFPFRSSSGGSFTRQLIGVFDDATNEYEIHTSTDNGETWTFRVDLGSGSINTIPDFAQFDNTLFITNGVVAPRTWNGSAAGTAGGTQSPQVAASATGTGALAGTYQWKLVSIEADGSRHPGSLASSAVQLTDEQGALSWTADADTDVVGYELYRSTGTGKVFYFVDYIDGRATASFTDNASDLTILENRVLEEHGDAPPTGVYYCEPHRQRMWWGRTDSSPRRAYFSDPGDPDSVWADNNYIDFTDTDTQGDVLTGLVGNFEGFLVAFLERSIWTVSGTGQVIGNLVDFSRTRTNAGIGAVHHRAVARVPAGAKYVDQNGQTQTTSVVTLAYFTPLGDIRIFDGDNDIVVSHAMRDTLANFNYANRHKYHCLHDPVRSHVTWFFGVDSETEPSQAVTWNYRWGIWYHWPTLPFATAIEVETSSDASMILAGEASIAKGGYCYEMWDGTSFDGSSIASTWMTKALFGLDDNNAPATALAKRWRWIDLMMASAQGASVSVDWLDGFADDDAPAGSTTTTVTPTGDGITSASGDTLTTAGGDSLVTSVSTAQLKVSLSTATGRLLHSEAIRLRVRDTSTTSNWALEGLTLAYQILPGQKRRFG
jgi:hypothetical protein